MTETFAVEQLESFGDWAYGHYRTVNWNHCGIGSRECKNFETLDGLCPDSLCLKLTQR